MEKEENIIRISVRALVEFLLRRGSLDTQAGPSSEAAMLEGARIHRRLQKKEGEGYQAEVPLRMDVPVGQAVLRLEGRADGIFCMKSAKSAKGAKDAKDAKDEKDADPGIFSFIEITNRAAAIGRTIIDHDDIQILIGLVDHRIQALRQILAYVIDRYNNRDQKFHRYSYCIHSLPLGLYPLVYKL